MAFIKICGMTDAGAVGAALAAGVDAVGFVFAPSVRSVTPEYAAQLALPARGKALCVAVTQHPDAALLQEIFEVFRPDVLQTDAQDLASMALPSGVKAWPVLRGPPADLLPVKLAAGQPLLFEGPRSGAGKVADWSAARLLASVHRLILAGGLSPANVADAIAAVQPFGVDVSSGVEESPGRKSAALIESFVSRARAAFARSGSGEC
jgi:phosphoribosylanthranilate isomerase